MKKKSFYIVAIILFFVFTSSNLLGKVTESQAKETVEKFFSLCKKNDFKHAAKFLAYFGNNKARLYKDFFNANNPDEFKEVKRICKKVTATLMISDSYSFGKFRDRTIDGKKFKSLDVVFLSGKQKVKRKILFIEIDGKPAIFE